MGRQPSNPYAAPAAAPAEETGGGVRGTYGPFRNNGGLKNALVALLVLDAMLSIFNTGVLNYLDMRQYDDAAYLAEDGASKLDGVIATAGFAHAGISLVLAVVFAVWINRSCKNAWLLDPPRMKTTPGWAVGYYFIPILLLWKPYGAMKEIRSASYGKDHALKAVLPLWWTFWLVTMFLSHVTFRLYSGAEDADSYLMACKLDLVSTPLNVILDYLAISLVTGITLAQRRRLVHWHQ